MHDLVVNKWKEVERGLDRAGEKGKGERGN
jgi:hypothetical protein